MAWMKLDLMTDRLGVVSKGVPCRGAMGEEL